MRKSESSTSFDQNDPFSIIEKRFSLPFLSDENLDVWTIIQSLHENKDKDIRDFIVSKMYNIPSEELEFFLPQLWY